RRSRASAARRARPRRAWRRRRHPPRDARCAACVAVSRAPRARRAAVGWGRRPPRAPGRAPSAAGGPATAPDGSFEWRVRPTSNGQLVIREVYGDWAAQRGTLAIAREDTAGTAPPPLTRETIEKRYATAGKQLVNRVKTWLQFPQWFYFNIPVNTMVAPRLTPGGLATQYSSAGHYELRPDQALLITIPVTDAPYLGFQLGSLWYISLDYINHQTSLNNTQAQADPDGKVRIVVAEQNPGVTNWVETVGHRKGFLQFRWQRVSRQLTEADGPTVELVDFDAVPAKLPYYEHNKISDDEWRARIALRQQQIAARMLG
uniref:hypothetical protein n=1 Tax=Mycobacterium avium TaxID=1764 RepID=UPI001E45C305